ncbi:MAG: ATP-binding protein [Candidatus Dormibacteria bacterium]
MTLILDEFQEGVAANPALPGIIRALWDSPRSQLRILVCGSAIRTMAAMQEARAPLYGRFDLSLLVHPFQPHEAALMLPALSPYDRAMVWGILGGMPLYLSLWDQDRDLAENIAELFCTPGGRLLAEGDLAMRGEALADLEIQVLHAVALGHTRHHEIHNAVRSEPTRQLERLIELQLVERIQPATEEGTRSRRRIYRVADNFFAFWLGSILPERAAIDRGLGANVARVLMPQLPEFLGPRWEEAFRLHLRRLARAGQFGDDVVTIGRFWSHERVPAGASAAVPGGDTEIDAVALAGPHREAVLVGEAKLRRSVEAPPLLRALEQRALRLPSVSRDLRLALAAPGEVLEAPPGVLVITAEDIFGIQQEPRLGHPRPRSHCIPV